MSRAPKHRKEGPNTGPELSRRAMLITPAAGLSLVAIAALANAVTGKDVPTQAIVLDATTQFDLPAATKPDTFDYEITAADIPEHIARERVRAQHSPQTSLRPKPKPPQVTAKVAKHKDPTPKVRKVHLLGSGTRDSIIADAKELFEIPYVWGGESLRGFDCSGLTQYVYGHNGLSLPRTSKMQSRYVTRVSNPKPGDLVFFGSPVHHVGIYVKPGLMIDAPHTGDVVGFSPIHSERHFYGRHPKLA